MPEDSYTPKPIDTSHVHMDDAIESAIEPLARNVHELWAQQRLADGWTFGPQRDDARKQHPGLVPYDQLDETERNYDRVVARKTIATLQSLGFVINPPATKPVAAPSAAMPAGADDELTSLRTRIAPLAQTADANAIALRNRYRTLALLSSVLGTLAVLLAIGQMFLGASHHALRTALLIVEAVSAMAALVGVVYGLRSSAHHRWLIERQKAERLRALDAEAMIRRSAGALDVTKFVARAEQLSSMTFAEMLTWLKRDLVPVPAEFAQSTSTPQRVEEFRDAYRRSRLSHQAAYLAGAETNVEKLDRRTRSIPPMFFFLSIGCVFIHAVMHPVHEEWAGHVAEFALLLAACLPVLASGLRTYREAVQLSRNAARYASKAIALELLEKELNAATTLAQAMTVAWHVEQVLESEHREWLRLMIDAEWYA